MSSDLRTTDFLKSNGCVIRDGKTYGCHIDLADDETPDGCVLDEGRMEDCLHGTLGSGRERKSRWTCPYWKVVRR